jgi:tripartite-type tricarboxylate transporter receptor subunit TctC
MNRTARLALALLGWLACGACVAQGSFPDKPVRMLVGYSAGGSADVSARLLAQRLGELWGKPVVVENVTGSSGILSAERVAKAAPDGYTLLAAIGGQIVVNQHLYSKLPYDPVRDFAPISIVSMAPNVLAVPVALPARNVAELAALARAQPGKLSFASAGSGTTQHLSGELFKSLARIDIFHVPYKGITAAIPDLLTGRVSMMFGTVVNLLPLTREGKLRGLAVTSASRFSAAPDLPTMIEAGYPEFDLSAWYGLLAPAGTPDAVIRKIHADTVRALVAPELRARYAEAYLEVVGNSPEDMARVIREEIPRWAKLVRDSGAKAE